MIFARRPFLQHQPPGGIKDKHGKGTVQFAGAMDGELLLRADRPVAGGDMIRVGELTLDVPRMRTEVAGTTVDLTPTEFTLLATLARQPGRIFTRSQLLDALHGIAFESYERAIDSHVKNLRRKLEPDPRQPRYVLTVYGVGYRLADDR